MLPWYANTDHDWNILKAAFLDDIRTVMLIYSPFLLNLLTFQCADIKLTTLYFPHNKHVEGKTNNSFSIKFLESCFVVWGFFSIINRAGPL